MECDDLLHLIKSRKLFKNSKQKLDYLIKYFSIFSTKESVTEDIKKEYLDSICALFKKKKIDQAYINDFIEITQKLIVNNDYNKLFEIERPIRGIAKDKELLCVHDAIFTKSREEAVSISLQLKELGIIHKVEILDEYYPYKQAGCDWAKLEALDNDLLSHILQ